MSKNSRYLMVHGHFYQPPRENPWTGQVEPQPSAARWPDWNSRISAECYLPMARSPLYNAGGQVADMYNNYAHLSFNFGPTLLSWMDGEIPKMLRHLHDAVEMKRTSALAQSYSHSMLPLSDARDRHTQILWGLREFKWRFGFFPKGMWLPECGIDKESLRALIDHGVEFVILSPHQASKARPFGESAWREVSMGSVDTRRAYRLFETDGAGKTHFDRSVDVIFYTPGLNLKVSFDHILTRPEELAKELNGCYDPGRNEGQLVSIVTDGEIYGHHEKGGEAALSRLFTGIAPAQGLKVCSAEEFLLDNPPLWEVKLWDGENGGGSSWSCEHGMGRWSRNCGCSPTHYPGWTQKWRTPLRDAFDELRDRIRQISRRELGPLLWDRDDARNDYIDIVLDPSRESRRVFLARHCQHPLSGEELSVLWRLLEAERYAMLMYTSCGWFFDELSGLEPVQNMCYALRAAELAQPESGENLVAALKDRLSRAKSNLPRWRDGGEIFQVLAVPSRYDDRELAAAMAMCLAMGVSSDSLSWDLVASGPVLRRETGGRKLAWGAFVCRDAALDRFVRTAWFADLSGLESAGVFLHDFSTNQIERHQSEAPIPDWPDPESGWLREMASLSSGQLGERRKMSGIGLERLPAAVREEVYRRFAAPNEQELMARAADLGSEAVAFLGVAGRYGAAVPDVARASAVFAVENGIERVVNSCVARQAYGDEELNELFSVRAAAEKLDFWASQAVPARNLALLLRELLHWFSHIGEPGWLDAPTPRELPGGGEWIAPSAPINKGLSYPEASSFAAALGRGLALWRARLSATPQPDRSALTLLPLPEILVFARRGGFALPGDVGVDREFWDFLGKPLARLIRDDPPGLTAGTAGDRLRQAGSELGFADDAVDLRLIEAARLAMSREDG